MINGKKMKGIICDMTGKKVKKIFDDVIDAARNFIRVFCEALDNVRLAIEKIKDAYRCDTSQRYQFVKFFSKLGYDERKMWTLTRHTRLARSDC